MSKEIENIALSIKPTNETRTISSTLFQNARTSTAARTAGTPSATALRPAPAITGGGVVVDDCGSGDPDLLGRPADGDNEVEGLTPASVGSGLGTVSVVKRVVVLRMVEVESAPSPSPSP